MKPFSFYKLKAILMLSVATFLYSCSKQDSIEPRTPNTITTKSNSTQYVALYLPNNVNNGQVYSIEWFTGLIGTVGLPSGMATSATLEFRLNSSLVLTTFDTKIEYINDPGNNIKSYIDYNLPTFLQPGTYTVTIKGNNGAIAYDNYNQPINSLSGSSVITHNSNTVDKSFAYFQLGPVQNTNSQDPVFSVQWNSQDFSNNAALRVFLISSNGTAYDTQVSSPDVEEDTRVGLDYRYVFFNSYSSSSQRRSIRSLPLPAGTYGLLIANTNALPNGTPPPTYPNTFPSPLSQCIYATLSTSIQVQ